MTTYSEVQPCCEICWYELLSDEKPKRMVIPNTEMCVYCGLWDQSGIYITVDPSAVLYPSLKISRE
jgi:hypothetical protein